MYLYDINKDEFTALKAIWEAAATSFGEPARFIDRDKAFGLINAAIDTTAEDPDQAMDAPAGDLLDDLEGLGYIYLTERDRYFMPVFVGWMVDDLKDHDFSTIMEDPTNDSYVMWAFHYIMWERSTGIEGRPNDLDVADEIEAHFKDDKKFEKRWGGENDLTDSAGELVITQLEENGYIERDFDGIQVTKEGEEVYKKLYDADVLRMKAELSKTEQEFLRLINRALYRAKTSQLSLSYIYAAYAYKLVAEQFQGTQATLKEACENIMQVLKDLHCIYINRYGHVRMTLLGEFAISHPSPLDN